MDKETGKATERKDWLEEFSDRVKAQLEQNQLDREKRAAERAKKKEKQENEQEAKKKKALAQQKKKKEEEENSRKLERILARLPHEKAKPGLVHGVLILEGGAYRGMYTAGVIDVLMENGINFATTIGISAGGLCGLNYQSGQVGRGAYMNLKYRHSPSYVGLKAMMKENGFVGFQEMLYGEPMMDYPLDGKAFNNPRRHLYGVMTEVESGKACYPEITNAENYVTAMHYIQASASLPIVSKPVLIQGKHYMDGGCSDPIPLDWAMKQKDGKKIVVIKTAPKGHRDSPRNPQIAGLMKTVFGKYKTFVDNVNGMDVPYNRCLDRLDELEKEGRVFLFQQEEKTEMVPFFEGNLEKLSSLYWSGRKQAEMLLPSLLEYLKK